MPGMFKYQIIILFQDFVPGGQEDCHRRPEQPAARMGGPGMEIFRDDYSLKCAIYAGNINYRVQMFNLMQETVVDKNNENI